MGKEKRTRIKRHSMTIEIVQKRGWGPEQGQQEYSEKKENFQKVTID